MEMTLIPKYTSIDEVLLSLLQSILSRGDMVSVRNMNTLEIHPTGFMLTNPRARCITNKVRKWSLPLAIGEFAWHLSASNDVNFISYYAKRWKTFSENGKTIDESCYGHKIFGNNNGGTSQWSNIIDLLTKDPATRRAVLSLYDSATNFGPFSKDVSCICTIQFLIRDNQLDAVTHMRSNDAMWGLPYDIFLVTMLQEYLATILAVPLGNYYHYANSMHLYEHHFELAENILEGDYSETYEMPSMSNSTQIHSFLEYEETIRNGNLTGIIDIEDYWKDMLSVLQAYHIKKNNLADDESVIIPLRYSEFIGLQAHALA